MPLRAVDADFGSPEYIYVLPQFSVHLITPRYKIHLPLSVNVILMKSNTFN